MNTSERNFFNDPGFEFCRVGDVNNDNIVGQDDIQEVLEERESSDNGGILTSRQILIVMGKCHFLTWI